MLHKLNVLPLLVIPLLTTAFVVREGILKAPWAGPERTAANLPPLETFDIQSKHTGVTYRIFVQLPHDYTKEGERYPVFYTLQAGTAGNSYDEMIAPLLRRGRIPQTIYVAITRPQGRRSGGGLTGAFLTASERSGARDTRTWTDDLTYYADTEDPESGGGAEQFAAFLEEELFAKIDGDYYTDRNDRGIGGTSLGASFAVEISYRKPGMFERAIAISPRVHFADFAMIDGLRSIELRPRRRPQTRLYIGTGSENHPTRLTGFEHLCDVVEQMGSRPVNVKCELVGGREARNELIPAAKAGLRFVYAD